MMRLNQYLARCGVESRRNSEKLIVARRVCVNGIVVDELGTQVEPGVDRVSVDGTYVSLPQEAHYLMLNKPGGYLTTMFDPQGRPAVASLMPLDSMPGLFPVGRLDCDTTGLLLFMTDGELAEALLHPRKHVEKRYEAVVDGRLSEVEADILRRGVVLDDGPCQPAKICILEEGPVTKVECTICEGRNRQVKRMFSKIGHPVLMLHRASFGPLVLDDLELGLWRELTHNEVEDLKLSVGQERG